jgi:hypothetical protein
MTILLMLAGSSWVIRIEYWILIVAQQRTVHRCVAVDSRYLRSFDDDDVCAQIHIWPADGLFMGNKTWKLEHLK